MQFGQSVRVTETYTVQSKVGEGDPVDMVWLAADDGIDMAVATGEKSKEYPISGTFTFPDLSRFFWLSEIAATRPASGASYGHFTVMYKDISEIRVEGETRFYMDFSRTLSCGLCVPHATLSVDHSPHEGHRLLTAIQERKPQIAIRSGSKDPSLGKMLLRLLSRCVCCG
eukprot:TRINITY_DN115113_c0_g1_i1.p1 TRINITY_DN115113_c0_g1~~TRINITY_DN115113_c0_g1_i1.p1  ORF type:complete len:191 (-),score=12.48 TRINITY_DN115113_c0_g1_i1:165-674(-)